MRWGEKLEFTAEAGPGDFIYVPPYVPHQEINASAEEMLECVLVRSDSEAIAVNLPNVEPVERPELVKVCFLFSVFLFFKFYFQRCWEKMMMMMLTCCCCCSGLILRIRSNGATKRNKTDP